MFRRDSDKVDKITTDFSQGIYLFSVMAESTALRKLSLDGNDLSMVPPEHVAKGTNRLREVSSWNQEKTGFRSVGPHVQLYRSTCCEV